MKQVAGVVVTACGIVVAAVVTGIGILWWTTADVIRGMRRR